MTNKKSGIAAAAAVLLSSATVPDGASAFLPASSPSISAFHRRSAPKRRYHVTFSTFGSYLDTLSSSTPDDPPPEEPPSNPSDEDSESGPIMGLPTYQVNASEEEEAPVSPLIAPPSAPTTPLPVTSIWETLSQGSTGDGPSDDAIMAIHSYFEAVFNGSAMPSPDELFIFTRFMGSMSPDGVVTEEVGMAFMSYFESLSAQGQLLPPLVAVRSYLNQLYSGWIPLPVTEADIAAFFEGRSTDVSVPQQTIKPGEGYLGSLYKPVKKPPRDPPPPPPTWAELNAAKDADVIDDTRRTALGVGLIFGGLAVIASAKTFFTQMNSAAPAPAPAPPAPLPKAVQPAVPVPPPPPPAPVSAPPPPAPVPASPPPSPAPNPPPPPPKADPKPDVKKLPEREKGSPERSFSVYEFR